MSLKVQINSLDVLERILGDDTEVEINIRENIAQVFVEKHLKSLLTHALREKYPHQPILTAVSEAVKSETKSLLTSLLDPQGKSYTLKEQDQNILRTNITNTVHTIVHEVIRDAVKQSDIVAEIEAYKKGVVKEFKKALLDEANKFFVNEFMPEVVKPLFGNLKLQIEQK